MFEGAVDIHLVVHVDLQRVFIVVVEGVLVLDDEGLHVLGVVLCMDTGISFWVSLHGGG